MGPPHDIRQRALADDTHGYCSDCGEDVVLDFEGACLNCGARAEYADVAPADRQSQPRRSRSPRRAELNAEARFRRAECDPAVQAIRGQFEWPLSVKEAAAWIAAQDDSPIGVPLSYVDPLKAIVRTVGAGEELWLIARTADSLARANGWELAAATAFILCGVRPPDPEPIVVEGAIGVCEDQSAWRRVSVTFDPDEDPALIAEEIKRWKQDAGIRQRKSADTERQVALREHVAQLGSGVGAYEKWNKTHPKWRYQDRRAYWRAAKRAKIADPGTWPYIDGTAKPIRSGPATPY